MLGVLGLGKPVVEPFDANVDRYEEWFDVHDAVYRSELAALEELLAEPGHGVEVIVGSGRFAGPLGVPVGVDPSGEMLSRARDRGVAVLRGVAERLPLDDGAFDSALFVTTVCFVDDLGRAMAEAERVLAPDGALVVEFVDRDSPVGERYEANRDSNPFYRDATFRSTEELVGSMEAAGFEGSEFRQTVFSWIADVEEPEPVGEGWGDGSFVAVRATR